MKNKVVVITGASGGLGKSLAKEFASKRWQVIGTGRSVRPHNLPEDVVYHQFDASNASDSELFWKKIAGEYSDSEICLVNNAGGYVNGGLTEIKAEDYEQQMRSSYFSAVYMTRGLALIIPKARIINIISSSALAPHKNNSAYGASKAAERHFFQSLQTEFSADYYQITNLYPFNIASHGPAENAMTSEDLSIFVCQQAENETSYYLRDVTIWPK